ncbi:MAG TPA: DUF402 domain-containing protein [Longimicrobiaceae bacterium]
MTDESLDFVEIHYRRLPDREQVFRQIVVADTGGYVVTLLEAAELKQPVVAGGRTVLEPGAPVVWITYRHQWHDVGRFHLADGTFTGVYANVLTPVEMEGNRWETTDLCLDLWSGADGTLVVLDEDELRQAEAAGWVAPEIVSRAREEAGALLEAARLGRWPGPEVHEWTLERAREAVSRRARPATESGWTG